MYNSAFFTDCLTALLDVKTFDGRKKLIDILTVKKIINTTDFYPDYSDNELKNYVLNRLEHKFTPADIDTRRDKYLEIKKTLRQKYEYRYESLIKWYDNIVKIYEHKNIGNKCTIRNDPLTFQFYLQCSFDFNDWRTDDWDVDVLNSWDDLSQTIDEDGEIDEEIDEDEEIKNTNETKGIISRDTNGVYKFYDDLYMNIGNDQTFKLVPLELDDLTSELKRVNHELQEDFINNPELIEYKEKYDLLCLRISETKNDTGCLMPDFNTYIGLVGEILKALNKNDVIEIAQKYDYIGHCLLTHYSRSEFIITILYNIRGKDNKPTIGDVEKYLALYDENNDNPKLKHLRLIFDFTHAINCQLCEMSDEFNPAIERGECGHKYCEVCIIGSKGICPMCRERFSPRNTNLKVKINRERELRERERLAIQEEDDRKMAEQLARDL